MEISRDEVRVMTVHGAKGLEAAVVFLVDTTSSPSDTQRLRLIQLPRDGGREVVVWAGRKAEDSAGVAAARSAMLAETEDEYRRLLYVAMTRAADRLVVGGCMPGNMNTVRKFSWYDLIDKGLAGSGLQEQTIETPDGPVKRYARAQDDETPFDAASPSPPAARIELPSWLRETGEAEPSANRLLRPSDGSGAPGRRVGGGAQLEQRTRAMQRGTLVHRLLQSLPDVTPVRRREAALRFLARNADGWTDDERGALADNVMAVLDEPRFAPVFASGSRAEVSIVGRLAREGEPPILVSGQIDRLVVTDNEVLIVDFKTNQAPPAAATEAPIAYVRQLALYRAVLRQLYPQRTVRAALLWTETTEFMEISASALDAELPCRERWGK
jgi:ATP-dependent helicase/nuclease subunit A